MFAILGPTGAGKSELAERLAGTVHAEIVSVDSMQVYQGMDIGTAKPSAETRARLPHHLIDLVAPEIEYTVADFQEEGRAVLADLGRRKVGAVIAGGSGLHFRALVDPLTFGPTDVALRSELETTGVDDLVVELLSADAGAGAHVDLANPRRVVRAVEILRLTGETPSARAAGPERAALRDYLPLLPHRSVGVDPGEHLEGRVAHRFAAMLARGLLEEVGRLAPRLGRTARQAVGYKQLLPVVSGDASLDEGSAAALGATMALAKRQRTFFRRDPRIRWITWDHDPDVRWRRVCRLLEEDSVWTS